MNRPAPCEATIRTSPGFDRGMANGWGYGVLSIDREKRAPGRSRQGSKDPESPVTCVPVNKLRSGSVLPDYGHLVLHRVDHSLRIGWRTALRGRGASGAVGGRRTEQPPEGASGCHREMPGKCRF